MDQNTINTLAIASRALVDLTKVWATLNDAWQNPTVAKILEENYPFSESFDELLAKVEDWNFLTGEELDIARTAGKVGHMIDQLGLSDTGTVQIIKKLNEKYKDMIDAYDAEIEMYGEEKYPCIGADWYGDSEQKGE